MLGVCMPHIICSWSYCTYSFTYLARVRYQYANFHIGCHCSDNMDYKFFKKKGNDK